MAETLKSIIDDTIEELSPEDKRDLEEMGLGDYCRIFHTLRFLQKTEGVELPFETNIDAVEFPRVARTTEIEREKDVEKFRHLVRRSINQSLGKKENDNVIENWRTNAWEIIKKDREGQLSDEEFLRLYIEIVKLRPDLRDKDLFDLLIEKMSKPSELKNFIESYPAFNKLREFIILALKEVLKEVS